MPIDSAQTTNWLRQLVRIDSVNPDLDPSGTGEREAAHWLAAVCRTIGLEVEMHEVAPGRCNTIARWRGAGGGKSLLLTGHIDTVSLKDMPGDPLDARIEGDWMYGRGTYDMKGGVIAALSAVDALKREGFTPAGDIVLGFVCDEEYASIGMEHLVKHVHADAAILTEPTDDRVIIAHKGFAWLTLTTHGVAAHGSRYDLGADAIRAMRRLLHTLDSMERDLLPQRTHALLGRPSVHASLIEGGLGLSTYPDACTLRIEHRLLPDERGDVPLGLWRDALAEWQAQDASFRGEVALDFTREGYELPADHAIVRAVQDGLVRVTGAELPVGGVPFWMDSAILGAAGIPTVTFGPTGEGAHAAVERVSLASVFRCAAVLAEAARAWCG
jgi:acetylornithine deacetylase